MLEVYLAEYNRLKDEQRTRINARDNFLYVTLTVVAAIAFFAFGGVSTRYAALFLLPPACFILGWTYLINDWKVSEIGHYLRTDLAIRLRDVDSSEEVLRWETVHREGGSRFHRKTVQMVVDLVTFCVPGLVAIVLYWTVTSAISILFLIVSVVEILGLLLLAGEIVWYADICDSLRSKGVRSWVSSTMAALSRLTNSR